MSGDTLVVGSAYADTRRAVDAGSVLVYQRTGTAWVQQAELTAPDGRTYDGFGVSVAVRGDIVVVGAPSAAAPGGSHAGAAYVYSRSGSLWRLKAKLSASEGQDWDAFGSSVALDGSSVVVGAPETPTARDDRVGAAYVFARSGAGWTEQGTLLPPDGDRNDLFGTSVALDGDTAVVGSPYHDNRDPKGTGAAYVFRRSEGSWTGAAKLYPDNFFDAYFGFSVAVDGSVVAVGVPEAQNEVFWAGSVHMFTFSGGRLVRQSVLLASEPSLYARFGTSVALSDDTLVIGAPGADTPAAEDSGAAYAFQRSGSSWTEQARLPVPDAVPGAGIGIAVGLNGTTAVVGAPGLDPLVGSVQVFVRSGTTWMRQAEIVPPE
ncbi:MAG: FG-GAP repeat protein [Geodermatophilaceae bacterium]|nr:FG-GAP repeat protein [Geodermatophilaceae bacterium]